MNSYSDGYRQAIRDFRYRLLATGEVIQDPDGDPAVHYRDENVMEILLSMALNAPNSPADGLASTEPARI